MKTIEPPLDLFINPAFRVLVRPPTEEDRRVREWEVLLRIVAGGRDGARAIDWARAERNLETTRVSCRRLSDFLSIAYDRIARGDTITADLEWRVK